jgi:hypothetical protein
MRRIGSSSGGSLRIGGGIMGRIGIGMRRIGGTIGAIGDIMMTGIIGGRRGPGLGISMRMRPSGGGIAMTVMTVIEETREEPIDEERTEEM